MKIGVPKEIKTLEFRVGMTPAGVHEVVSRRMPELALANPMPRTKLQAPRSWARLKRFLPLPK